MRGAGASARGRLRNDIDIERLDHLISLNFTASQIARDGLLGGRIHRNTIANHLRNRGQQIGLSSIRQRYTQISDSELTEHITELNNAFPNSGAQEVLALLRSRDPPIVVQRQRVGTILARIDPVGTARRWAQAIRRRPYSVPTPNAVWHIDSNHALIR